MRGQEGMRDIPPCPGPALAQRAGAIPSIPLMPSHPSSPSVLDAGPAVLGGGDARWQTRQTYVIGIASDPKAGCPVRHGVCYRRSHALPKAPPEPRQVHLRHVARARRERSWRRGRPRVRRHRKRCHATRVHGRACHAHARRRLVARRRVVRRAGPHPRVRRDGGMRAGDRRRYGRSCPPDCR
jgi:hypothetical protein